MDELRSFGSDLIGSVVVAKHFYRHKCFHEPKEEAAEEETAESPKLGESELETNKSDETIEESQIVSNDRPVKQHLSAFQCILDLIGDSNPSNYIVATQDHQLKNALKSIPGVPVLCLVGQTPTFEPISAASMDKHRELELEKMSVADWEKPRLPSSAGETPSEIQKKRRKKGKNPLSCLSKQPTPAPPTTANRRTRSKRNRSSATDTPNKKLKV